MKNFSPQKLFLNILVLVLLTSCALDEIKSPFPAINKVNANHKYKINLPEDHSSGYMWRLNDDYDHLIIEEMNSVWHGNKNGIDFNFKTLASGQTTLTFVSRKYTDTADIKQFVVQINGK